MAIKWASLARRSVTKSNQLQSKAAKKRTLKVFGRLRVLTMRMLDMEKRRI